MMLSNITFRHSLSSVISFVFFVLLFTSCDTVETPTKEQPHTIPEFVTGLFPVDNTGVLNDVSLNVIQGIAGFENGWFVTQKSGASVLLLNYLDSNGVSLFHTRIAVNSHGQDLSLEQISDNELRLYTTYGTFGGTRNTGLLTLQVQLAPKVNNVRDWSLTTISIADQYPLNYTNATPCINKSKDKFSIRSLNTVLIHKKSELESGYYTAESHFELNNSQLIDNENFSMWFQGIEMSDSKVFCLTGNGRLTSHKKIYTYNINGQVVSKYIFDSDDFIQNFYDKFEPEGLYLSDNQLYFTIMTKSETAEGNVKYLYKITI